MPNQKCQAVKAYKQSVPYTDEYYIRPISKHSETSRQQTVLHVLNNQYNCLKNLNAMNWLHSIRVHTVDLYL